MLEKEINIRDLTYRFVLPKPSKCFFVKVGKNENALVFSITQGYIETDTLKDCYYVTAFFLSHKEGYFQVVGKIDKIKKSDGTIIYRQRIKFTSYSTLLQLIREMNATLVVGNEFCIDTNCLEHCGKEIPTLKKYASKFKIDINSWLTLAIKLYIHYSCVTYQMLDKLVMNRECLKLKMGTRGFLDRSPYLCDTDKQKRVSIYKITDFSNEMLFSENADYGYTSRNIRKDKKKGEL